MQQAFNLSRIPSCFILIAILLLSVLLRFPGLNQSLWLDEGIEAYTAIGMSFWDFFTVYLPNDFNPPLHYLVTRLAVMLLGESEIALRLPSLLAGTGIVFLGFRFLQSVAGKGSKELAVYGSLLLVTAPLLIYYSQEARAYELAALLGMWSMVGFYQYFVKGDGRYREYFLITSLMFLTHYAVWLLWLVQVLLLILFGSFKKHMVKIILPLTSCILLLPLLIQQLAKGLSVSTSLTTWSELGSASIKQIALIPIKIVIGRVPVDGSLLFGVFFGLVLVIWGYIVLQSIVVTAKQLKRNDWKCWMESNKLVIVLGFWLVLPVVLGFILAFKVSLFTYFRFLYIVPAFYLLLALGMSHLKSNWRFAAVILFLGINTAASLLYLFNQDNYREDWRELVSYIKSKNAANHVVIIGAVDRPFWYYDRETHTLIDYAQVERVRSQPSLWLVTYAQPIFDPAKTTERKLSEDFGFEEVEQKNFRGDVSVKYLINPGGFTAYDSRY